MTEAERIEFIISSLEGGNGERFAKKIGKSTATVSRMRHGILSGLNIAAILETYPQINREWLETGEGYPGDLTVALVKERYLEKIKLNEKVIDTLVNRINELQSMLKNK